jgi:dipeptidyl aminopeptidase/acylaminoacyl peptidase
MPFDADELWVGELADDGSIRTQQRVAGGADESVYAPQWSPDGLLYFVSDAGGWWNLWRWRAGRAEPVCPMEAEVAWLPWVLGASPYGFESATRVVLSAMKDGLWQLVSVHPESGEATPIEVPFTDIWSVRAAPGRAVFAGGSPTQAPCIAQVDLASGGVTVLHRSGGAPLDPRYVSLPEPIEFPTQGDRTAHAFFYPPTNPDYAAPPGERPPLLVIGHGGPTMHTWTTARWDIQFWTSRGIAVLDVNYGGSTGYGRAYRQRLRGQWGVVDVDDVVRGAVYLVETGRVDPERLAIRGGSAGGYLTLCALTFRDGFKAGASYYGIGDLELLAQDTHKLEAHYLDSLVGPYPERRDLYRQRSPIHHLDRLSAAIIVFQGLEDRIVPPNQAERMVEAVRAKGLPVATLAFEHEGHGFRRSETIRRCLDAELDFYATVLSFELPERREGPRIGQEADRDAVATDHAEGME